MSNKKESAKEAYTRLENEVNEKMEKLQKVIYYMATDEKICWGHVGSMSAINQNLADILEGWEKE